LDKMIITKPKLKFKVFIKYCFCYILLM